VTLTVDKKSQEILRHSLNKPAYYLVHLSRHLTTETMYILRGKKRNATLILSQVTNALAL